MREQVFIGTRPLGYTKSLSVTVHRRSVRGIQPTSLIERRVLKLVEAYGRRAVIDIRFVRFAIPPPDIWVVGEVEQRWPLLNREVYNIALVISIVMEENEMRSIVFCASADFDNGNPTEILRVFSCANQYPRGWNDGKIGGFGSLCDKGLA